MTKYIKTLYLELSNHQQKMKIKILFPSKQIITTFAPDL